MEVRTATVKRKTKETDIAVAVNLDGSGACECKTGIGFLDHMLEGFARHGLIDLQITCDGDLHIDSHHTAEDIGIALGDALRRALGDKAGIRRFGSCALPMDETLILCAVDLSGRPCFVSDVAFTAERLGELDTEMIREFFYAVSYSAGMNLHLRMLSGGNNHHVAEACFKAFARALDEATRFDERVEGVWSTKGNL